MRAVVDTNAQIMTLTLDNQTVTFTGADFLEINVNSGGSVGLITWGERVGYDNVVLTDLSTKPVPTASLWALLLLTMILGLVVVMNKRRLF